MNDSDCEILVPAPSVAKEFGITRRTLGRWMKNPALKFPRPTEINNRLFFARRQLEAWKQERVRN